ncbi:glycosyl transferase [Anopheles sinensis]|uniref:Glycosyl transferase n=1 Tax=Anopheles sinensis TaxID=74873 RepID=A0A084VY61_ANOSI|nr:glycosyl transferase [Anopheles sinensis]
MGIRPNVPFPYAGRVSFPAKEDRQHHAQHQQEKTTTHAPIIRCVETMDHSFGPELQNGSPSKDAPVLGSPSEKMRCRLLEPFVRIGSSPARGLARGTSIDGTKPIAPPQTGVHSVGVDDDDD